MLQQTQVSRVLEKFDAFIEKFPTVRTLAAAPEDAVLATWSGLGYYRRARLLHGAAKAIVKQFGGEVPREVGDLRELPGVGAYTAGAIASMVYGLPEPLVDGNVARVLMRLSAKHGAQAASKEGQAWSWERAGKLVRIAGAEAGAFNEALMELGATVCTARGPRCASCPVAQMCEARAEGVQEEIPVPKAGVARKPLLAVCLVVRDGAGRVLLEQRQPEGMWAGLWQAPTLERAIAMDEEACEEMAAELCAASGVRKGAVRTQQFMHVTTHRDVQFVVYEAELGDREATQGRVWASRDQMEGLGMSNAQRRVLGW